MNENNFDITFWLKVFQEKLISLFGNRIKFFGLQGSYGRGEQTADSDIDVVIILDEVNFKDLQNYQSMLDSFDEHDMICGFVSGERELINWEKSDILQLVLDTKPIIGSLEHLQNLFSDDDIRRSVLTGACNLYHACSHNFLHAKDSNILAGLYKSARFTVRMKNFLETGNYIGSMKHLSELVTGKDRTILDIASSEIHEKNFDEHSRILLEWTSEIITGYHG
ncbi:nucleotidyltransferase domain-containing protein [Bacteroides caecigallinarum]|uniref:nucleotidyltransferase domain-containing protein n=1 Tax=Bacteroides caecigallinarum TaxID=1411144 RepID=UPI001F1AC78F|nr:nucleotidyltransferase domain-containing protein [Bacteroides caecigallinarum]MCF2552084.1 nucleotidyltransferase domain-containing protein [Bacteroides caecigallinarum]